MLHFHHATFALLAQTPRFSPAAAAALDERERSLGVSLPPAVREWYALAGTVPLLRAYSNDDRFMDIDHLGEKTTWDHDDELHRALYGDAYDDPTMVPFVVENAGVFQLAFKLDGSDDPPVYGWWHDDVWRLWAESFSRCLHLWLWDHIGHYRYFRQHCKRYVFAATEPSVQDDDLQLLRARMEELPQAFKASRTLRFQRGDQHLTIGPSLINPHETHWSLEAGSSSGAEELVRTVWPCGTLATTLWSAANYGLRSEGQTILDTVRGVRE